LTPRILALWSAPRSRSTAFFRMMTERGDFQVVHEPFSYLAEFGESAVAGRVARSEPELLGALRALAGRWPVFFKDTTDERYPGVLADQAFLAADAVHTFIIRHPRDTIASYHAVNPKVVSHQIGFEAQYEIYRAVHAATGAPPLVIDADDLVARPQATVRAYCAAVGIGYLPQALRWQPGSRPEWQPTRRWHVTASVSTGFASPGGDYQLDVAAHPVLGGYLRHHLPFYEAMHARRLTIQP